MLSTEFEQQVDVYKVHKELLHGTKKETDSYQDYVCKMLEIAKQVSMKSSTIIKYIIAGIRDEEINKVIVYGAKNIRKLKEKLTMSEAMKENTKTKSKRVEERSKRTSRDEAAQERVRGCFLCENKNHLSTD